MQMSHTMTYRRFVICSHRCVAGYIRLYSRRLWPSRFLCHKRQHDDLRTLQSASFILCHKRQHDDLRTPQRASFFLCHKRQLDDLRTPQCASIFLCVPAGMFQGHVT